MTNLTPDYLKKAAQILKDRGVSPSMVNEKTITSGIKKLGGKLGYELTGELDIQAVIDRLHSRFCDVPDTAKQRAGAHVLDYGTPIGRWSRGNLRIGVMTAGYKGTANPVATAPNVFTQYAAAAPFFSFTFLPPNVGGDITIRFVTDGSVPSNGGRGSPPQSGNLTLDGNISNGSLLPVMLHEAGHTLGLSHSTDPNSVMYAYVKPAAVLDPETIQAIQSMYGWTSQKPLGDRASTHGPSMAVVNFPSLAGPSTSTAYMAWKGAKGDSTLWWAESSDGRSWGPQQHLADRASSEGPCLATYHPRSPDGAPREGLFMAWKGVSNDHAIYWATNPNLDGWSGQNQIPVGASARPALIEFNNRMILVWKGVPGDSGIYWSKFDGVSSWSPQQGPLPGRGTSDGPALAVFNGQLHMFWKGVAGDDTVWRAVLVDPGNGIWGPQQQVTFTDAGNLSSGQTAIAIGASTSFSIANRVDELVLAWKGVPGDHSIWFSRFNGKTFSGQMSIPNAGTESYPSIANLNGKLIAAWRGIGDDRVLWVSSLG